MRKHPKTGQNVWGRAEYLDILKRRADGQTLKEIGKIYGVSGQQIYVKLRRHAYLESIPERKAELEEKRRVRFKGWGFVDDV